MGIRQVSESERLHETPFHAFDVKFDKSIKTSWSIALITRPDIHRWLVAHR